MLPEICACKHSTSDDFVFDEHSGKPYNMHRLHAASYSTPSGTGDYWPASSFKRPNRPEFKVVGKINRVSETGSVDAVVPTIFERLAGQNMALAWKPIWKRGRVVECTGLENRQ